jgi:hypothetical protein
MTSGDVFRRNYAIAAGRTAGTPSPNATFDGIRPWRSACVTSAARLPVLAVTTPPARPRADRQPLDAPPRTETARGQESHLLGASGGVGRHDAEAALPDGPRALQFGLLQIVDGAAHEVCLHTVGPQLLLDARRAEALAPTARQHLDEARFGQQLLRFEIIEQLVQLLDTGGMRRQLARQFTSTVLTACEVAQRPRQQRDFAARATIGRAAAGRVVVHGRTTASRPGVTRPRHRVP